MYDVIRLLPDHVANQIAAGEVEERPFVPPKKVEHTHVGRVRFVVETSKR